MKKILLVLLALAFILSGCRKEPEIEIIEEKNLPLFHFEKSDFDNTRYKIDTPWYENYRVVAHAFGSVNNHDYTNSYEALVTNYNLGTRVFEVDFASTSDGVTVLLHEWAQYHDVFHLGEHGEWTEESSEYFLSHAIYDELTPMSLDNLLEVMKSIDDFYIVMDSKTFDEDSCKAFYTSFIDKVSSVNKNLLKRFIPQAYSAETYDIIKSFEAFDDIILTCYSMYADSDGWKIYEIVRDRQIKTVVMHMNDDWAKSVIRDIYAYSTYNEWTNNDFNIYIHTINDDDVAKSIVYDEGFYGIYSDTISEVYFRNNILE